MRARGVNYCEDMTIDYFAVNVWDSTMGAMAVGGKSRDRESVASEKERGHSIQLNN